MVTMGDTEIKEWLLWGILRSKNGYYGDTEIKEWLLWEY